MLYIWTFLALHTKVAASKKEWGSIKTKIITKLDGTKIKTKYGSFVEVSYALVIVSPTFIKRQENTTKAGCATLCFNSLERCLFYQLNFYDASLTLGECALFSNLAKSQENKFSHYYSNPSFPRNSKQKYFEIKVRGRLNLFCLEKMVSLNVVWAVSRLRHIFFVQSLKLLLFGIRVLLLTCFEY